MTKIKFLTLLATLDDKELAEFGKHLKTAHTREKIALRVFDYFKKFHPNYEEEKKPDLDVAARSISKSGVAAPQFNRISLLNSCHDLHGWLREFLLLKKATDKSVESEFLWLSVLNERRLKSSHEKAEVALFRRVQAAPRSDVLSYLKSLETHYIACFGSAGNAAADVEDLLACRLQLGLFHEICRLKINCEILNWQNQDGGSAAFAEANSPAEALAEAPLWVLYGKVRSLLSGGGEAEYAALETALESHAEGLAKEEIHAIWTYMKNHNSLRLRLGDEGVWERAHRLDKLALRQGLFLEENGLMSPVQFFNMVNAAGSIGERQWAEKFIDEHAANIETGIRYEVSVLAKAILFFTQKEYAQVLKKLKVFEEHRFRESHYAIRYRSLKLISLYELRTDFDKLWNDVASFEAYLRRSGSQREEAVKATLNFLRFYKKLFAFKLNPAQVVVEIKTAKSLYFRAWLLEKFEHFRPVT